MTDRDTFAAAALTGMMARVAGKAEALAEAAYRLADAMLRERDKTSVGVSATGAESVSTTDAQGFGRSNEYPCQPFDSAPTTQPAPPCVEADGFSSGSRTGQINRTPERQSPDRECVESSLRDVPQQDNCRAAGGPEHHSTEPVAWAVTIGPAGKTEVYEAFAAHQKDEAIRLANQCRFGDAGMKLPLAPLYFDATLTDEDREAVEQAIDAASGMAQAEPWAIRTLRGLLERLGGER